MDSGNFLKKLLKAPPSLYILGIYNEGGAFYDNASKGVGE